MKVLIVHNRYKKIGGEDKVVKSESRLLKTGGQSAFHFEKDNCGIVKYRASLFFESIWSSRSSNELVCIIEKFKPDIIHIHNTFPLISPSIYNSIKSYHVPVVQTLHNFRLLCANALFLRGGLPCEDCLNKIPWRSVVHACYRNSRSASFTATSVIAVHRALKTYEKYVDRFIVLSEFSKAKFVEAGFDESKLCIKPNFVDVDKTNDAQIRYGGLFVGRLSHEKGVGVLIEACHKRDGLSITLIGDGDFHSQILQCNSINHVGIKDQEDVYAEMQKHLFLVVPSICYESFGRVVVEAFANSLPVIASDLGSLSELVEDGVTGLLFNPGDSDDLAEKLTWANTHQKEMLEMGENARRLYEEKYTPDQNYEQLMNIYNEAIEHAGTRK